MAYPGFMPVIGSGPNALSDIMGQQSRWAGFNLGVQENNMARAAQAEAQRNHWLARLSDMQNQEAARQAAMQQRSQELAIDQANRDRQFFEGRHQFDVEADLKAEDVEARKKHWDYDVRKMDKAQDDLTKRAQNFAENKVNEVAKVAADKQAALDDATKAEAAMNAAAARVGVGLPGDRVSYSPKAGIYTAKTKLDPEIQLKLTEANDTLADHRSAYQEALGRYREAQLNWNNLEQQAGSLDLTVVPEEDGITLLHNFTGKKWKAAKKAGPLATGPFSDRGGASIKDYNAPASLWAGFRPATTPDVAPAPTTATASTNAAPLRIGRFTVIPR